MANEKNLIPLNQRTKEEQREIARKGGKASGVSRRQSKTLGECAKMLMSMEVAPSQQNTKLLMKSLGIEDEEMTYSMSILVAMLAEAARGDVRAAEFIRRCTNDYEERERQAKIDNTVGESLSLAEAIERAYKERENG